MILDRNHFNWDTALHERLNLLELSVETCLPDDVENADELDFGKAYVVE